MGSVTRLLWKHVPKDRVTLVILALALVAWVVVWGWPAYQNYQADKEFEAYRTYLRTHPEDAVANLKRIALDRSFDTRQLQEILLICTGEYVPLDTTAVAVDLELPGTGAAFHFVLDEGVQDVFNTTPIPGTRRWWRREQATQ